YRIEFIRVKPPADPLKHCLTLLMGLVSDGFKEIGITANAANVFGRAGSLTLQADWVLATGFRLGAPLKHNLVFPRIAEVVLIHEPKSLATFREDVAELRAGGIFVTKLLEVFLHQHGVAITLFSGLELVQMAVRPAHRRLDVLV